MIKVTNKSSDTSESPTRFICRNNGKGIDKRIDHSDKRAFIKSSF